MKRTLLILLAAFSPSLNLPDHVSAKLYEAHRMGVEVEPVEIGDTEPASMMCLPAQEEFDEEDDPAPENADAPPRSGPLL